MKRLFGVFFVAGAVIFASTLSGCATASSIGGTSDMHGLMSKAPVVAEGATEIASYSVILGLIDSGYEEYAAAVKAAEAAGKKITSVTKTIGPWYAKITAYAR